MNINTAKLLFYFRFYARISDVVDKITVFHLYIMYILKIIRLSVSKRNMVSIQAAVPTK